MPSEPKKKVCIIETMPLDRPEKMTIRLTHEEAKLRDELADHLGVDGSGVMRMGLLKLARAEGIPVPETKQKQITKKK